MSGKADPARGTVGTGSHGQVPFVLLYAVPLAAFAVLYVARRFDIIADEPMWAYALAIGGSMLLGQRLDRWSDVERGSWRLHVRMCVHAATVMVVIYLTGWGPPLGMCFVYAGLVDLSQSGAASWPVVLGWSLTACAAGQVMILVGWMPSFLTPAASQAMGGLGAIVFGIVIRMAAGIGQGREDAEGALAHDRHRPHHRRRSAWPSPRRRSGTATPPVASSR